MTPHRHSTTCSGKPRHAPPCTQQATDGRCKDGRVFARAKNCKTDLCGVRMHISTVEDTREVHFRSRSSKNRCCEPAAIIRSRGADDDTADARLVASCFVLMGAPRLRESGPYMSRTIPQSSVRPTSTCNTLKASNRHGLTNAHVCTSRMPVQWLLFTFLKRAQACDEARPQSVGGEATERSALEGLGAAIATGVITQVRRTTSVHLPSLYRAAQTFA